MLNEEDRQKLVYATLAEEPFYLKLDFLSEGESERTILYVEITGIDGEYYTMSSLLPINKHNAHVSKINKAWLQCNALNMAKARLEELSTNVYLTEEEMNRVR